MAPKSLRIEEEDLDSAFESTRSCGLLYDIVDSPSCNITVPTASYGPIAVSYVTQGYDKPLR